jgi:hypothetical protein
MTDEEILEEIEREHRAWHKAQFDAECAEYTALIESLRPFRSANCTCSDYQLEQVGCDCGAEYH